MISVAWLVPVDAPGIDLSYLLGCIHDQLYRAGELLGGLYIWAIATGDHYRGLVGDRMNGLE